MPPPPPPSKSYLLKFDSDTEEEDSDCFEPHEEPPVVRHQGEQLFNRVFNNLHETRIEDQQKDKDDMRIRTGKTNGTTTTKTIDENIRNNSTQIKSTSETNTSNSDDADTTEPTVPKKASAKNKKRNQKKRNKRKQKKKQQKEEEERNKPRVRFSNVSILDFPRSLGVDTVPGDGGWPLGMEFEACPSDGDNTSGSDSEKSSTGKNNTTGGVIVAIEDYEASKQERLRERWEQIKLQISEHSRELVQPLMEASSILETRQWDYKEGLKNPLFRLLAEDERRALFLDESSTTGSSESNNNSPPSPQHSSKRRTRSNSVTDKNSHHHDSSSSKRRSRSNSVTGEFNEKYDQVTVHHVRNELETLRNSRSQVGGNGCTCRKLVVYLPPKDGSGGKRAQHRRLKPQKLTAELRKRGLYHPKASRDELELILFNAVQEEPCCSGNDCGCAQNGITCQAETCTCWYASHLGANSGSNNKSSSSEGGTPVEEIVRRCGNRNGMYAVDLNAIDEVRQQTLNRLRVCQPIGVN